MAGNSFTNTNENEPSVIPVTDEATLLENETKRERDFSSRTRERFSFS